MILGGVGASQLQFKLNPFDEHAFVMCVYVTMWHAAQNNSGNATTSVMSNVRNFNSFALLPQLLSRAGIATTKTSVHKGIGNTTTFAPHITRRAQEFECQQTNLFVCHCRGGGDTAC